MKLRHALVPITAFAVAGALAACSSGGGGGNTSDSGSSSLIIGTTDKVTALDPAGSWDLGSASLQNQVFGWLLTSKQGQSEPEPDLAESAEFTSPTEYTVKLRSGLKFANGNDLTASDVVFSFQRQVDIADPNGPSSLLSDMKSVAAEGDDTVVFTLTTPNNQLWPQILTSPAGVVVDEDSFSADSVTSDDDIVKADAFDGQYSIDSYKLNTLVSLKANPEYDGLLGKPKSSGLVVNYYADESNLKLDVQKGDVDVAFHTLTATDVADLKKDDAVKVYTGPGAALRFIVFDMKTMPFGNSTPEVDVAKALAVRQAAADLIDRQEIADQVYKGTFEPAYSQVPSSLPGANPDAYKAEYGDGNGGPDADKAKQTLADAGVSTPVTLKLQYNTDHYGESSADEYALIKSQLEEGGLFKVDLQSTEWTSYVKARSNDEYPVYQLGWFADYPDADNYANILYGTDASPSFLGEQSESDKANQIIAKSRTEADTDKRADLLKQAQDEFATYVPTIPLLQGTEIVVAGTDVKGVEDTLDASFRFRFGSLSK